MTYLARVNPTTWVNRFMICTLLLGFCAILPQSSSAQMPDASRSADALPSAPQPKLAQNLRRFVTRPEDQMGLLADFAGPAWDQAVSSDPHSSPAAPTPGSTMRLTRTEAELFAIKSNPRISVGRLLALAQHQIYRET